MFNLVLCRSDAGDGGWSLHAPGSSDEQIAHGEAPSLISGESERDPDGNWLRPNLEDYLAAKIELLTKERDEARDLANTLGEMHYWPRRS